MTAYLADMAIIKDDIDGQQQQHLLQQHQQRPRQQTPYFHLQRIPNEMQQSDLPDYWKLKLRDLHRELQTYKDAKKLGSDGRNIREQANRRIVALYKELSDNHPDPEFRLRMAKDAQEWEHADERKREMLVLSFVQGLGMLVAAPFLITGAILHATGQILVGLGDVITLRFSKKALDDFKSKKHRRRELHFLRGVILANPSPRNIMQPPSPFHLPFFTLIPRYITLFCTTPSRTCVPDTSCSHF